MWAQIWLLNDHIDVSSDSDAERQIFCMQSIRTGR